MKKTYFVLMLSSIGFANPYWDPSKVAKDGPYSTRPIPSVSISTEEMRQEGFDVLRVDLSFTRSYPKNDGNKLL